MTNAMTEREKFAMLKSRLIEIYAFHGKATPSGKIAEVIIRQAMDKPAPFMDWAVERLAGYEKLPGNMSLELHHLYAEWRSKRGGGAAAERRRCADCDREFPGFFFGWRESEQGIVYECLIRCMCNDDPGERGPRKSKQQAVMEGYVVRPRGEGAGYARFVRERFAARPGPDGAEPARPGAARRGAETGGPARRGAETEGPARRGAETEGPARRGADGGAGGGSGDGGRGGGPEAGFAPGGGSEFGAKSTSGGGSGRFGAGAGPGGGAGGGAGAGAGTGAGGGAGAGAGTGAGTGAASGGGSGDQAASGYGGGESGGGPRDFNQQSAWGIPGGKAE